MIRLVLCILNNVTLLPIQVDQVAEALLLFTVELGLVVGFGYCAVEQCHVAPTRGLAYAEGITWVCDRVCHL